MTRDERPADSRSSAPHAPSPRAGTGGLGKMIAAIVVGLVAGLGLMLWLLPRWLTTPSDAPTAPAATTSAPAGEAAGARKTTALLYFVAADGAHIAGVAGDVPFASSPAEQARAIVEAQLGAAPQGRVSAIPAGTALRGLYLTANGTAYVDVSREIITGHPGGSTNEALTVYTIVNAVTSNLREVTRVQILVEGAQVDTLVGHLDLRQPLPADPRWIVKGS